MYSSVKFERDKLNIFSELQCQRRLGGRGGGDAKTIISPNTSFGDITISLPQDRVLHELVTYTQDKHSYL